MRLPELEQQLVDVDRSAVDVASIARQARDLLRPPPDVRGSTEWKAAVVAHVLEEGLTEALEGRSKRA
jgi:CO/xanthine dehydrogenase FAD-binding subunit